VARLATITGVLWFATACAHSPPERSGRLHIKCCGTYESDCPQPDESRVSIDGVFAGLCTEWYGGRDIRAGRHQVEIETPRSSRQSQDVIVPEGGHIAIEMRYFPMPD
jgi:hypothetical protein